MHKLNKYMHVFYIANLSSKRKWSEPLGEKVDNMHERKDLIDLIGKLQKQKNGVWKRTAELLAKSRRKRIEVNLSKIDAYAQENSTVLVPGKVLGTGNITKKITISAFAFSKNAQKTIHETGSTIMSIDELLSQNPEGKGVYILI